jgi:hypothetical protein
MIAHAVGIAAATTALVLLALWPFLPGPYDSLAVPLSMMAQLLARGGLLLVPVGALWLVSAYRRRAERAPRGFVIAAVFVSSLVWAVVSLGAAAFGGTLLGIGAVALWVFVLVRVARGTKRPGSTPPHRVSALPYYLVLVPLASLVVQEALIGRASEFSRGRAIRNSERLIAGIEQYRSVHGRYPLSLLSLNTDYRPSVIGIKRFQYEPSGEAYNLLFEQRALALDTREIVVYNPRDEQVATSHDSDLLQFTSHDLERRRGYYAVRDTPHPHWKYFLFD